MKVINNTARIINFGDIVLIPTEEVEIPNEAAKHPRLKEMIEDKELDVTEEAVVEEEEQPEDNEAESEDNEPKGNKSSKKGK